MRAQTCLPIRDVKRSSKIWTSIYRFESKFSFQVLATRFLIVNQGRAFNKSYNHIVHINWQMAASPSQTGKVKCSYTIMTATVDGLCDIIRMAVASCLISFIHGRQQNAESKEGISSKLKCVCTKAWPDVCFPTSHLIITRLDHACHWQ